MGACTSQAKRSSPSTSMTSTQMSSLETGSLDFQTDDLIDKLSSYLNLVGCITMLPGYLRDRIEFLFKCRVSLLQKTQKRKLILVEVEETIQFLYEDKHFAQSFPMLRENFNDIRNEILQLSKQQQNN